MLIMPLYDVQKARPRTENVYTEEFVRIPRRRVVVLETAALAVTSVLLVINTVLGVYSWWGEAGALGMGEGTREGLGSPRFSTPFSPAPWTFAAWIAILATQFAWLIHAWSYSCRQKVERAISPFLYPLFWSANCVNLGYLYAIGHLANELSLALIAIEAAFLCVAVVVVAMRLRRLLMGLTELKRIDKWAVRLLTLNGLALYAAWAIQLVLYHLASVLEEDTNLHSETITTCILSLVGAFVVSYFLLEATILDRYLRCVLVVYPTVIWWLGGILDKQWNNDFSGIGRNDLFAFVLLLVGGGLFLIRLVLIVVFAHVRPLVGGGMRDDIDGVAIIPY